MKKRIFKILGVAITLGIVLSLVFAGLPLNAAVEKINEWYTFDYPAAGSAGDWFRQGTGSEAIDAIGPMAEAINGDLYAYVELGVGYTDHLFKSTDGGRTWAATGYEELDIVPDIEGDPPTQGVQPPGAIVDMVCSSIDEDILYVTDGNYVYKTVDGGDTFDFVARDSLEEALMEECGRTIANEPITCIDVGYDADDNPFVFIGTKQLVTRPSPPAGFFPATVLWIGEAGYPATWTDLDLSCYSTNDYGAYSIGCSPNWADSKETYVVVSDGTDTHVISTIGVTCSWTEVAELKEDCLNPFGSRLASRIGFPDDWEETETLFVGVTGDSLNFGGDVYLVTTDLAIDLNVAGISTGCVGVIDATNIISLDIFGDTEEASLIAGVYGYVSLPDFNEGTNVYCSTDGGWSWDVSAKDPTGTNKTYVLWYGDSALAATSGYECAVSLCCGEEFPCEFWNQISLIATNISCVIYGDHSPGYLSADSQTMFMLTISSSVPSQSLFRYDGTYWERVFCSTLVTHDYPQAFEMVLVSPDFLTTNAVFVANSGFEIWRSLDAGCSWDKFTFPCSPRPWISAAVVIDEDTGIVGGMDGPDENSPDPDDYSGTIFKTERHGARPWNKYEVATTAGNIMSFDLEPGYEDPGSIILGDDMSQVFISEDGGETWNIVGAALLDPADGDTSVIFDPGYATNHTIYAATGNVIARCVIDPDEAWADQVWEDIGKASINETDDVYWGIVAVGDTALYVSDKEVVGDDNGGVLRSLNPLEEEPEDVVFERIAEGLTVDKTRLSGLMLTTDVSDEGCAENVLWSLDLTPPDGDYDGCKIVWIYEDTLAAPIVLNMPVDGQKLPTTHSATLSWNELCGAECYEVYLAKYCPECPEEKIEVPLEFTCPTDGAECTTAETCIVVGPGYSGPKDGLEPGMTYYWQVRVCKGHPTLSKWSEERTFMTALLAVPELCSPECGGQDIILTPNFSWDEVPEAAGYDIELAITETFTAGAVRGSSTVNAWVYGEPLEYGTTYYWRVRAEKNGVFSDWTVCIFTTIEEPVEEPPPVVIGPTPPAPVVPPPMLELPPTPIWVWAIIGIGAALAVVVIVLIVRSRRPPAQPPV